MHPFIWEVQVQEDSFALFRAIEDRHLLHMFRKVRLSIGSQQLSLARNVIWLAAVQWMMHMIAG